MLDVKDIDNEIHFTVHHTDEDKLQITLTSLNDNTVIRKLVMARELASCRYHRGIETEECDRFFLAADPNQNEKGAFCFSERIEQDETIQVLIVRDTCEPDETGGQYVMSKPSVNLLFSHMD